jgi:hypothetical protein
VPGDDDYVRETLGHGNLQVDRGDPDPRPMIAILDARPGMAAGSGMEISRWLGHGDTLELDLPGVGHVTHQIK